MQSPNTNTANYTALLLSTNISYISAMFTNDSKMMTYFTRGRTCFKAYGIKKSRYRVTKLWHLHTADYI